MQETPLLRVENLSVTFAREPVLAGVDFALKRGETLAVIGPNGAGKTVLLRAILDLVPYEGTISIAPETKIGYVPQRLAVERDAPITVGEFLRLRSRDPEKIQSVLEEVDPYHGTTDGGVLAHEPQAVLKERLGVLSGGQFQKILIAWALLGDPDLLLFDEPTAGLDASGEETIYELFHRLQDERGFAILLISHDLSIVSRYAENILCLNRRPVCFGPPHRALDPRVIEMLYGTGAGLYPHNHTDKISKT